MHILDIARVFNNDGEGKKTDKARYFSDVHSSNFQRRNFLEPLVKEDFKIQNKMLNNVECLSEKSITNNSHSEKTARHYLVFSCLTKK